MLYSLTSKGRDLIDRGNPQTKGDYLVARILSFLYYDGPMDQRELFTRLRSIGVVDSPPRLESKLNLLERRDWIQRIDYGNLQEDPELGLASWESREMGRTIPSEDFQVDDPWYAVTHRN